MAEGTGKHGLGRNLTAGFSRSLITLPYAFLLRVLEGIDTGSERVVRVHVAIFLRPSALVRYLMPPQAVDASICFAAYVNAFATLTLYYCYQNPRPFLLPPYPSRARSRSTTGLGFAPGLLGVSMRHNLCGNAGN